MPVVDLDRIDDLAKDDAPSFANFAIQNIELTGLGTMPFRRACSGWSVVDAGA